MRIIQQSQVVAVNLIVPVDSASAKNGKQADKTIDFIHK